tara:strand:+ start:65 stop:571 length:507 start_codon:yes stop_codon:yes gene_type:complete
METYEEVIDAYNLSSEKKEGMSLTDYIKTNNIKIREIELSPLDDLKKVAKKADGGIMLRENYRAGTMDPDEIPELEEMPSDEYLDLLKQLGAPGPGSGQESRGIKSLDKGAPSIKMADADPLLMREYEQYVFEMKEMGKDPISLSEFIRMIIAEARMGVKAGGLTSII